MTGAIVGQAGLFWIADVDNQWFVIPSGMLAACVGLASGPAIATGEPAHVQVAVARCIRLIIVFDAVLVLAVRGLKEAIMVVCCMVPLVLLRRLSRVT